MSRQQRDRPVIQEYDLTQSRGYILPTFDYTGSPRSTNSSRSRPSYSRPSSYTQQSQEYPLLHDDPSERRSPRRTADGSPISRTVLPPVETSQRPAVNRSQTERTDVEEPGRESPNILSSMREIGVRVIAPTPTTPTQTHFIETRPLRSSSPRSSTPSALIPSPRESLDSAGDIGRHSPARSETDSMHRYTLTDPGSGTSTPTYSPSHHSESYDYQPVKPRIDKRSLLRTGTPKIKRAYTLFKWGYNGDDQSPMLAKQDWPDEEGSFEIEHNLYDHHREPLTPEEQSLKGEEAGPTPLAPVVEVDPYLVSYTSDDPRHPYNWSDRRKYGILVVMCTAAVCVTVSSSIQASTYTQLMDEFGVPRTEAVAGVSLYVLGFGLGARKCFVYYRGGSWGIRSDGQ